MAHSKQRELALAITRKLRDAGYEAYWAGGCVRDQLLQTEPKDYDVATNARPEQVRELFGKRRTLAIGAAFGVIAVLNRDTKPVEVATFRSDGAYIDGRRPSSVEFTTAEQDAQRRDFTINGMFYDPIADRVIDYVGGQADLQARVIRAIGDPQARFAEDKLRMLRAVRFATILDFSIEPATLAAIRAMASEINVVSAERIGAELGRLLTSNHRANGIVLLARTGLLTHLLPELADGAAQQSAAWQSTVARLGQLDANDVSTPLAALCLDFGSDATVAAVGRRYRFSNKEIDLAVWLCRQLGRVEQADRIAWPELQRILVHENSAELLQLARATIGADHPGVLHCENRLAMSPEQLNPAPLLTGDDLVRHGYRPGPQFAGILTAVRDAQLEGHIKSEAEALALVEQLVAGADHS